MKDLSVVQRLLLAVLLPILLIFSIIASLVYWQVSRSTHDMIKLSAVQGVEAHAQEIARWFDSYRLWLRAVTQNEDLWTQELDSVKDWLNKNAFKDSNLLAITFVNLSGEGITYLAGSKDFGHAKLSDREYFQELIVKQSSKEYVSNVLIGRVNKKASVIIARAIENQEKKRTGLLLVAIALEEFNQITSGMKLTANGYGWVVDGEGLLVAHPSQELRLKMKLQDGDKFNYKGLGEIGKKIQNEKNLKTETFEIINDQGESLFVVWTSIPRTPHWALGMSNKAKDLNAPLMQLLTILLILFAAAFVFLSAIIVILSRRELFPLKRIVAFVKEIQEGNLSARIEQKYLQKKDEFGTFGNSIQEMAEHLKKTFVSIHDTAQDLRLSSKMLTKASGSLSSGSSEQAATIEEVTSSVLQIAGSIKNNATNSKKTQEISLRSSQKGDKSGKSVSKTVASMQQISEKISIVQEIANQTRLLSLNASIEAARAGDAGKGFAVVASEVSKLAELSSAAAKEIEELTSSSVAIANEAGQELAEFLPEIEEAANLMETMAVSNYQQEKSIEQINTSLQQVNEVIQRNAAQAEELAATANDSAEQAENLHQALSYFRIDR